MKKLIKILICTFAYALVLQLVWWMPKHIHSHCICLHPKHHIYTVKNALYTNPELITPDQNIWWYRVTDIPSNTVVTVIFDDEGTPNNIYDDSIIGLIAQH